MTGRQRSTTGDDEEVVGELGPGGVTAPAELSPGGVTAPAELSPGGVTAPAERRTITAPAAHIARRLAAAAGDGFEPEAVALRGGPRLEDVEVEVVVVRRAVTSSGEGMLHEPAGSHAPSRVLVGPVPFRDGDRLGITHAPRPHDRGRVASVAVAGTARDDDGAGLVIAFVWWVDPDHLVPWGLHLHALSGDTFHAAPSVRVLAEQGTLVEAHPVMLPGGTGTLSLWHGRGASPRGPRGSAPRPGSAAHASEGVERWIARHMARIAATHAQLVVVRDGEVLVRRTLEEDVRRPLEGDVRRPFEEDVRRPFEEDERRPFEVDERRPFEEDERRPFEEDERRPFEEDEDGARGEPAPGAHELAMRLGSVSKVVTGLVAAGVVRRLGLPGGLDTPLGALGVLRDGASPTLRRVTLAQLLDHTSGLVTSADLRPDDARHPLSELRVARDRGTPDLPLAPGDLLRWFEEHPDDRVFVREPGSGRPDYGNEGAILLGEILGRLALGRDDGYEALAARLFTACGVETGDRGCLFGAGVARSVARREVMPRPTSITWAPARFDADREVVPSPHADNGPFLGGAAGLAVPLAWMGALLAAIGRRDADPWAPTRADLEALTVPSAHDPRFGRGLMRGTPTYLPMRRVGSPVARAVRVLPLHHLGRIDGGSALLLHMLPLDPADGTGVSAVVAFDRLGPLDAAVDGAALLALLRPVAAA